MYLKAALFLFSITWVATVEKHPEIALNPDGDIIWYSAHAQHC